MDVAAQREVLERQAKEVEEELFRLRRSINALSLPNALPVEILSHILAFHSTLVLKGNPPWKSRSLERVRVTQVCHHWREVALKSTSLWSNLILVTPAWAEVSLRRSKMAPVSIDFNFALGGMRYHDTLSRIVSQPHRLRSVKMALVPSSDILPHLTLATPILEEMVLGFRDLNHRSRNSESPMLELPDNFLGRSAPALRHLELVDIRLPSYSRLPLPPSLTHLQLGSTMFRDSSPRPSADEFLESLRHLPHLKTLMLTKYAPVDALAGSSHQPVLLPALNTVHFMDSADIVENLLRAIRMPQASLSLIVRDNPETPGTLHNIVTALAAAREVEGPLPLKDLSYRMQVQSDPRRAYSWELGFGFRAPSEGFPGGSPPGISVAFQRSLVRKRLEETLTTFSEGGLVHIDPLESLQVDGVVWVRDWAFLAALPSIRSATLNDALDIALWCQSITPGGLPVQTSHGPTIPVLPFPSLYEVSVSSDCLSRLAHTRTLLVKGLEQRPEAHRIVSLRITRGAEHFTQEDCQSLRDDFPDVEIVWEEEKGSENTDDSEEFSDE